MSNFIFTTREPSVSLQTGRRRSGEAGLWYGMILCGVFLSVFFTIYLFRINWKDIAFEAQERAGMTCKETLPSVANNQSDITLSELPFPEEPGASKKLLPMKEVIVLRGLTLALSIAVLLIGVLVKVWTSY